MMRDFEREQKGNCKTLRVTYGVKTITLFFWGGGKTRILTKLDQNQIFCPESDRQVF